MRASLVSLLSSSALGGPIRSGLHRLVSVQSSPGPWRVGGAQLAYAGANFAGTPWRASGHFLAFAGGMGDTKPLRVSGHYFYNIQSIHRAFYIGPLASTSQIIDLDGWDLDIPDTLIPEFNPYRPRIPEALYEMGPDFYNFYEENQNIHRQQHNLQQAGDTTFPWQLFEKSHTDQQFTLGSIGRFYHETLGLIQCRYVQFDFMTTTVWACSPVGLVKNKALHEWVVTNRYDLSDPDLVVGFVATIQKPTDGEYGWVIVDGPNITEIKNVSTTSAQGETFAWDSTGAVSNTAQGRVIGRRINKVPNGELRLAPAQFYIQIESFSLPEITATIQSVTQALQDAIDQLETDVAALKLLTGGVTFTNLAQTLAFLQTQLDQEKAIRQSSDIVINNRISNLNFVTVNALNVAITNLQSTLQAADNALSNRVDSVEAIALQALALAQAGGFDPTALETQISLILGLISDLNVAPKNKFPVVDGSVPPNLVYLDDGSLVYVETV